MSKQKYLVLIVFCALAITLAHYTTAPHFPLLHDFYRRMYYLPIILSAFVCSPATTFWVITFISLLYIPHVFQHWGHISMQTYDALLEIALFYIVGTMTATLVARERQRSQELEMLKEKLSLVASRGLQAIPKKKKDKTSVSLHFNTLVGESRKMQDVYRMLEMVGPTKTSVLITGESGVGKELVAKALHVLSKRSGQFVAINCAAIPETLLESELFGYVRGAFTGAEQDKPGKFVLADKGTLFLDEIGTLSAGLQAKLLRVLQEEEVQPVGGNTKKVDVRIISATNDNLAKRMQQQEFRSDLFYRLNVIALHVPSLRERTEDIPALTDFFLKKYGDGKFTFSEEIIKKFKEYPWPGNIRELENVIRRAIALNHPESATEGFSSSVSGTTGWDLPPEGISLEDHEKQLILQALQRTNGNQTKAAKLLGLTRPTLIYRLEKYNIK
jgi:transcriptional regulator with PAS, ATPase and Fis domain